MAGWKKHFTTYNLASTANSSKNTSFGGSARRSNHESWLPEIYAGTSIRVDRYRQYDLMDQDGDVNAALDVLSEFCTESEEGNLPFLLDFEEGEMNETELEMLNVTLASWVAINEFETRIFKTVRHTLKYGDHFYIRDPETYKLYWIDPANVEKVVVNEADGKRPFEYHIRNLELNLISLVGSAIIDLNPGEIPTRVPLSTITTMPMQIAGMTQNTMIAVAAEHVVHISLASGDSPTWPFGMSILEAVYKPFKQKEMLEDAVLIYRVQRAPERRVFYIDVGDMPRSKAMAHLEDVKNEINQKRIPSKTGGGDSIVDATYNPMSMIEDYFFAQRADSRGSKVETLPGGDNLGEIDDLKYFDDKMQRALRIPEGYLPRHGESGTSYNDGRVGTAYIQEYRFTKYCKRLQAFVQKPLDREFKMFLKMKGVVIESNRFKLVLAEPQNFSKFRQIEIDSTQIGAYNQINDNPHISKRFAMTRYLGWSEEDILENEKMLMEERNPEEIPGEGDEFGGGGFGGPAMGSGSIGDFEGEDFGDEFDEMEGEGDIGPDESGAEGPVIGGEPEEV